MSLLDTRRLINKTIGFELNDTQKKHLKDVKKTRKHNLRFLD